MKTGPCGACTSCVKITSGNSPDIFSFEPEGKGVVIGIDSVRGLKREAQMKPFESRYRVFIVDGADLMTPEAGNSILKTLEEAAPGTVFILIAGRKESVLPTIRSRLTAVRFSGISEDLISRVLIEKHGMKEEEALFLARFSEGRIGMAISMATAPIAERKNSVIDSFLKVLSGNMIPQAKGAWEYEKREDLQEEIGIFMAWLRDAAVVKSGGDERFVLNSDRVRDITRFAETISMDRLLSLTGRLAELDHYVESNVNVKIIVDALVAELATADN
jgi:DNA polymerase-3 subunit delta'